MTIDTIFTPEQIMNGQVILKGGIFEDGMYVQDGVLRKTPTPEATVSATPPIVSDIDAPYSVTATPTPFSETSSIGPIFHAPNTGTGPEAQYADLPIYIAAAGGLLLATSVVGAFARYAIGRK